MSRTLETAPVEVIDFDAQQKAFVAERAAAFYGAAVVENAVLYPEVFASIEAHTANDLSVGANID